VPAQPWIDLHAHPGRCFLAGLDAADPFVGLLGGPDVAAALAAATAAGMAAITCSTVADLRVLRPDPVKGLTAARAFAPGEAHADHDRQLAGIGTALAGLAVPIAVTAADIEAAHASGRTAVMISCEGADFLEGHPERLSPARAAGASSLTLVHYRVNELGDVQTEAPVHGGLTRAGRAVVAECNRIGMIIDCAHATFETTMGVLAVSSAPIMISHSHLDHAGRSHPRLLSTEHARAVADAGGLIGAWPSGVTSASLADFAAEIARLADVVGVAHVAVGTDLDANYKPVLRGYADFAALPGLLADRGLTDAETGQVLGGNAVELLRAVAG
jgi:membrane dipeptidase